LQLAQTLLLQLLSNSFAASNKLAVSESNT
jgi:hypothetical protein